jgi:protein tyrosine/serine phosphatase
MGRILGALAALALIGGPVVFAVYDQAAQRNFHVVKDGELYRSGQMSVAGLQRVQHDFGIRTLVSLREHDKDSADRAEERYCAKEELNFIRLEPLPWEGPPGTETAEKNLRRFLEVIRDPNNRPVLLHCFAGIHRTGAYVAVYRMEVDHWSNEQAIAELKAYGYTNLDSEGDILGFLQRYRPSWRTDP